MSNYLFSLRSTALVPAGFASALVVGTMEFHATTGRQTRLEFVTDLLLSTAKRIAVQQNRALMTLFGGQGSARVCKPRIISPVPSICRKAAFFGA